MIQFVLLASRLFANLPAYLLARIVIFMLFRIPSSARIRKTDPPRIHDSQVAFGAGRNAAS